MGHSFEQFHFRYQHPWILSMKAMVKISEDAGFIVEKSLFKQRYNLSNLLMWLTEGRPQGNNHIPVISEELEEQYKRSCEQLGVADYMCFYLRKN